MQVKIALCQLKISTDKTENIQTATNAVKARRPPVLSGMPGLRLLCTSSFKQ